MKKVMSMRYENVMIWVITPYTLRDMIMVSLSVILFMKWMYPLSLMYGAPLSILSLSRSYMTEG